MLQSVLFDKQYNSPADARQWLRENDIRPIKPFHITDRYIRARTSEPMPPMRTITLDKRNHVKAVVNMPRVNGGRAGFGPLGLRRPRALGGAIGSDLAVGTATVALPFLIYAAKKLYDKAKGGSLGGLGRRPRSKPIF